MKALCASVVAGLGLAGAVQAQFVYLPPSTATSAPVGTGLNSPTRSFPRAIQELLPGSALAAGGTTAVNGLTFRGAPTTLNAPGPWPAAPISFSNYDIYLGVSSMPAGSTLSGTFADNVVPGTDVLVRSGPLTIPAGSWTPSAWGTFTFAFGVPFPVLPSQNYILTIRHTGSGTAPDFYMDTVPPSGNYQDAVVATQDGYTATAGVAQGAFLVTRFQAVPGPGAWALLAGAAVFGARRRR